MKIHSSHKMNIGTSSSSFGIVVTTIVVLTMMMLSTATTWNIHAFVLVPKSTTTKTHQLSRHPLSTKSSSSSSSSQQQQQQKQQVLVMAMASRPSSDDVSNEKNQKRNKISSNSKKNDTNNWMRLVQKTMVGIVVTATVWGQTATLMLPDQGTTLWSSFPASSSSTIANAKEMASGSGRRVNKDPESLLRYGLPINNPDARKVQATIEEIKQDIGSKRKSAALDGVKKAKTLLVNKKDKLTSSCQDATLCTKYIDEIVTGLEPLGLAVKESQDYLNGSEQERLALDKAYAAQKKVIETVTLLEEQMIPKNYQVPVPEQYTDYLPVLRGRATVEMIVVKADKGDTFEYMGKKYKEAKMNMIIDGYSSPITAGNFIDLVQKGFYNNMAIQRSDGFVIQTGDPIGDAVGYVGAGSKAVGNGPNGERLIPLEVFVKDDVQPFYESTIEDEGRGGQATVLPFSAYGAMGWAREEYDPNSGSSQFFWLLFDSDLTPAGKNVLDGRYPCFGYVVEGADFLKDVKEGDIIVSAKVTQGGQNLVQPKK